MLAPELRAAITSNGFVVHPEKAHYADRNSRRSVTGVKINAGLNVDRLYVRRIRAMLHSVEKLGRTDAQARYSSGGGKGGIAAHLRGKIAYVHFRNVSSGVPSFEETFIDNGYVDMFQAMRIYHEVGFPGVLIPDHTPAVAGDTPWGHRGRAYAIGYMKAMLRCITEGC